MNAIVESELEGLDAAPVEKAKAFPSINLGFHTKLVPMSLADLVKFTVVANREYVEGQGLDEDAEAQRSLNVKHAQGLAAYMLNGLLHAAHAYHVRTGTGNPNTMKAVTLLMDRLGRQSYLGLAPIVATIPDVPPGPNALQFRWVQDPAGEHFGQYVFLPGDKPIHVIDGQHRRYAASQVIRFLEDVTSTRRYPKSASIFPAAKGEVPSDADTDAWTYCQNMARRQAFVMLEIHLGLNPEQQRQFFYDLNSRGLTVSKNLAARYDMANPAVRLMKELPEISSNLQLTEKAPATWDDDTGEMLFKDALGVCSLALANAKSEKGVKAKHGDDEHVAVGRSMWQAIAKIPGIGQRKARQNTVAAQPVVLKGIARAIYECAWLDQDESALKAILGALPAIDFSHDNPVWTAYIRPDQAKSKYPNLFGFIPENAPSNGFSEIGADKLVHFRPNAADIYPIVASMIRMLSGLQPRK